MSEYFKRDDVIEAMMSTSITNNAVILCNIAAAILKISAADVRENVHAHWIAIVEKDVDGNGQYNCSACGAGESHRPNCEVPFCWKCGAVMDEETV